MALTHLQGILQFSALILSFIVLAYSIIILKRSHKHKHRRPWEVIFIASIVFVIYEVLNALKLFSYYYEPGLIKLFETLLLGLVLYAFLTQHELLLKHGSVTVKAKK